MVLAALSAAPAVAQDDAEGIAFDDALKSFGYSGGAALQCVDEAGKAALTEEALQVFNSLAQLFGTDRAFFFAASFGAGTVDEIDTAAGADYEAEFAEALRAGRAAPGERVMARFLVIPLMAALLLAAAGLDAPRVRLAALGVLGGTRRDRPRAPRAPSGPHAGPQSA